MNDKAAGAPCPDCVKAARHAYSDATTPGFFSPLCAKHRTEPVSSVATPGTPEREGVVIDEMNDIRQRALKFLENKGKVKSAEPRVSWGDIASWIAYFVIDDRAATPGTPPMEARQKKVAEWAKACFGEEHCANLPVRGLRLLEEAIEFAQAVGAPKNKCAALVEYVYSRAVGNPLQELGGIGVTWLLAAEAYRVQAETAMDREIERVLAKPPSYFTERNQQKCEAGFDAPAPSDSQVEVEKLKGELAETRKSIAINSDSAERACGPELWMEACGTIHVAIHLLQEELERAEASEKAMREALDAMLVEMAQVRKVFIDHYGTPPEFVVKFVNDRFEAARAALASAQAGEKQ